MKIKAEIMFLDGKPNKNGRIYTAETANNILETWREHKDINFGDVDYDDFKPKNICGQISNIWLEGDTIIAEGELFDNHIGTKILKELNKVGLGMYLSFSGAGTYDYDNKTIKDYELVCFHLANESAFYVSKIEELYEC